ncbi:MAG: V-type ATP synthase subunit K [Eubacteriales bacterium]|nr:V-type ATP synthase subunit K [Eubacteriales bacterium]
MEDFLFMEIGQALALLGAAIAVGLSGIGSSRGVGAAGETASAVASENPEVAGKLLVLQLLPATQGIYGFLIAVIVLIKLQILGGAMAAVTVEQGLLFIAGCLPIGLVGLFSAIYQGKVAASAMVMTGEHPDMSGRGITMTVMVETYAVLSLLVSFLVINSIVL